MSRYRKLTQLTTQYATKMNVLRNKIFGDLTRPTRVPSMKVISLFREMPVHKNPEKTVDYYPRHEQINLLMDHLRNYGLYRDEHKDFQEEMLRLRALRGKKIRNKSFRPS